MMKPGKTWKASIPILMIFAALLWASDADKKLHMQGKKYLHERQWEKAVETYRELLSAHPGSLFTDDARFWIGFAFEQMEGREADAFAAYQKLTENSPESPWADDAVIHQLTVAKRMVMKGKGEYGTFLKKHVSNADSSIRYQAALALGELKDPAALPVLEEMVQLEDPDLTRQAMILMGGYSQTLERLEEAPAREASAPGTAAPAMWDLYRDTLGKKGPVWTADLLYLNGLYHIVPGEDLTFFLSLENRWDREEWLRKFWAAQDPTPTTPENEAREEFERRVLFARKHFGREWANENDYYPPWDARGEVYIRFGSPDTREHLEAGWERWVYYDYRMTLNISSEQSNVSGDHVHLGTVSRYLLARRPGWRAHRLPSEPKLHYTDPFLKKAKNISGMDFRFVSAAPEGSLLTVVFSYSFPASNLKLKADGERYIAAYRSEWVLYDEDYRKINGKTSVNEIPRSSRESWSRKTVDERIEIVLPPGKYMLALRVEDLYSNRLGIYKKTFTAQPRTFQEEAGSGESR